MTDISSPTPSRRSVLQAAASAAALWPLAAVTNGAAAADSPAPAAGQLLGPAAAATPGPDAWHGLKVGVASYSFRRLPLDVTIKAINRVALRYVSVKDFHLPLKSTTEERKAVAKSFLDAGITPLSCGNISLKNDEASARLAFEYARDLGVPTIVCAPTSDALPLLDKLVKEFNIRLAIHNHGPEDKHFPAPSDVWEGVQAFDERIGLCIDVGHTARAKSDPAESIVKYKARLYDVHFKDIVDRNAKNAGAAEIEVGRGVLDIRGMLKALVSIGFSGHVGFEHEKTPLDPLPGLAESVGYTKASLAAVVA